ncbi:MAG: protein kinase [Acidobacteria bacterium]|nr:protein kinase [Acidobacteriota bacterium]
MLTRNVPGRIRFGAFELDLEKGELRKRGIRLRLPDQSFEILAMLVAHPGELVGREEIRQRLWPNGTIVEFEHSVNSAVKRLRDALGDSGSTPRFIETVPRRGYRFRERVETLGAPLEGPRFRVLAEAGRGAMGVVYRAEDIRLGRTVALKVLPEEVASDRAALDRLRREARIAASLNHPGICTLHGIEEHEGRLCLVMEFLEGTPLDRLIAAGPLAGGRAIDIAIQVSAALSAAHARGIVHRDIKPGNLFVTEGGSAKVMDFGIAAAAGDAATASGGTPSYASPEQSQSGPLDGRSDIFSFGTVLYEMLTGRRLFQDGDDSTSPVWPANVPKAVQRVVARCVEEDPAKRFQTADELSTALKRLKSDGGWSSRRLRWAVAATIVGLALAAAGIAWKWGAAPSTRIRSIAVLPMVNLSGDPAQEYFADGITDALTSDLAEVGDLRVISRTSAMTYKGSRASSSEIGRRLKVDALLEGSVLRQGSRVRVVAQLIDASTDTHLWSKTYERDLQDVLRMQSDVALAIASAIHVAITPERKIRLAGKRAVKPEAYETYLKGMFHLNKFTPEGFSQGISYLQQAIERDPADASAYAALALGFAIMAHDGRPEEFARSKAAARKSLELGGPLPEAYAALGMVELYFDWDFAAGAKDLERALELNPNFAEARRAHSWYLLLAGRGKEGLAEMKVAESLEPLAPIFPNDLGWQYLRHGYPDAALGEVRKALELDPNFAQALALEGLIYLDQKMNREALAAQEKAAAADPAWRWAVALAYAHLGQKAEARRIAAEIAAKAGPMEHWGLAAVYAELGDNDEAFRCLEEAYKARFSWLPWDQIPPPPGAASAQDLFAPLRADPRFQDLGRRIGVR